MLPQAKRHLTERPRKSRQVEKDGRHPPAVSQRSNTMARIVAVTACPTGIAHTIMAAEALKKTAVAMGHQIKVETQGSGGTQNILSAEDIAAAEVVILAADIRVGPIRFVGK